MGKDENLQRIWNDYSSGAFKFALASLVLFMPSITPFVVAGVLYGLYTDRESNARVREIEETIGHLRQQSKALDDRLTELTIAAQKAHEAARQGHQVEIDRGQISSRDLRHTAMAYEQAVASDEPEVRGALTVVAANAILGRSRGQAEAAAMSVLPHLTAEGLGSLMMFNLNQRYITGGRGVNRARIDPLVALGLAETNADARAPELSGAHTIRLTSVGRALREMITAPR